MSFTEIYGFNKKGFAYAQADVKNAWRGAMAIWGLLEKRYLPPYIPSYIKRANWYHSGMSFGEVFERVGYAPTRVSSTFDENNPMQAIWDLAYNEKVSITDRIVLMTTFDKILVKKEDLPKVIEAFNNFEGETSLKEQAVILQEMLTDENCIAVGWNQTSVNSDTWLSYSYDEESDEEIPYNCLAQNEHYWLFDELEEEDEKIK